jgi:N-acetylmuramoyl-L-alanine amidase
MRKNKHSIIAFVTVIILGVPWLITTYPQSKNFIDNIFVYVNNNFAAVFLHDPVTVAELKNKYNSVPASFSKVRILIVPGHEPMYGGAQYENVKEREMAVALAKELETFFKNNSHYEVILSRDNNSWNTDLQKYFTDNSKDILEFFNSRKDEMVKLVNNGTVTKLKNSITHNTVKREVAMRLYGINKWVNDNKIDIAIHIHFNDYPRKNITEQGKYSGFAIYVPEKQYFNSVTTRVIADSVYKRLEKYNAISNMPKEGEGIIEEQDLIAIGAYNTTDAPSMLIEYGYIYQPEFIDPKIRESNLKDLAFETYLGIQDFFGSGNDVSFAFDTLMLPYSWKENISKDNFNKNDVLALQTALILEGVYPSGGQTKNECPRTGKYGQCTAEAIASFQKKYNIKGEKEMVGEETKKILNNKYSGQVR